MVEEDIINEPQRQCDFCKQFFPKEEMRKNGELDVCESCFQGAIE